MQLRIKVKMKDNYHVKIFLDSVELLKKITKHLWFHLNFKTVDLQDISYTTLIDDIKINFDKFFFYVPIFILDAQTQIMFDDSIKTSFKSSFESRSTDRKFVDTQLEYQVDIGSAQNKTSPKYLIVAHQTAARLGVPNKASDIAVFDNLDVRKNHVDNDGVRYLSDGVSNDYASTDYLDRYRDLKLFQKQNVGEELLNFFIGLYWYED